MDEPAGIVRFVAKPGRVDDLVTLLAKIAEAAALDDGCELYSVHRARRDPDVVFVYELYRDKHALKTHQQNSELAVLGSHLRELTASMDLVVGNLVAGDRACRT
jgi:(4S)-4-hydroxy-5-phosphonooxypentane-2,3-dione isomerase